MMIESVLDECLEAIRANRSTIAECLAQHPDQAAELELLLQVALAIESVPDISLSEEFKKATLARILRARVPPTDGKAGEGVSLEETGRVRINDSGRDPLDLPITPTVRRRRTKFDA